jgi:16S rRNA (uracil1498-N3)-methyltransferase
VGFAPVKGAKPEAVAQKLTELGIDRIVPLVCARSVVRWDGVRAAEHVARLRRVAREAAAQCRRVWLPEVDEVVPFSAIAGGAGVALAEPGGPAPGADLTTVLVGPEGGWDDAERSSGPVVGLSDGILRAETAAVVAGALLAALRSGFVASAGPPA